MPRWGLGIYKVNNTKQPDKYFYLDSRDSDFGSALYNPDFFIYFNNGTGKYNHRYLNPPTIPQGSVVRVWDIHSESPNTSGLQNYWNNTLIAVNDGNNHPLLIWGPYPSTSQSINGYRVFRKYGSSAWQLLQSVDNTTYEYTDETVILTVPGGQSGTNVYYYVKPHYGITQFPATNTVEVNVQGGEIEKQAGVFKNHINGTFSLSQNYPNPFNPKTQIDYIINLAGLVTIKVYDVLGNEVASLVNERKQPGNYSEEFDAGNLPSGIYIYKLTAGSFTDTKKLILLK